MATQFDNGAVASTIAPNLTNATYPLLDKIFRSDMEIAREENRLKDLYKGSVENNGAVLEQILVELATPYEFDKTATTHIFGDNGNGIHAKYYTKWNEEQTARTLYKYEIRKCIARGQSAEDIAQSMVLACLNGDNNKIYTDLKGLLVVAEGYATASDYQTNVVNGDIESLLEAVKNTIDQMTFNNNKYCLYANKTPLDNIRLAMSYELYNKIEMKLANVLNLSKVEIKEKTYIIDTPATEGTYTIDIFDINSVGFITNNTDSYTEEIKPQRKIQFYYDNDKMYYYCDFFKFTKLAYNPTADASEGE